MLIDESRFITFRLGKLERKNERNDRRPNFGVLYTIVVVERCPWCCPGSTHSSG